MFGFSTIKLIGMGIAALAVIALITMVLGWRSERNELREWQSGVLTATRTASANPKLGKKDVAAQITLMGKAIADLKGAIVHQNAAIDQLALTTVEAQAAAKRASQKAEKPAGEALATSARLNASARSSASRAKPCEPSKTLRETWR